MKITFISQASILIESSDCTVLTDPWYVGMAFNDSWKLFPEAAWKDEYYDKIDYLWISHEHPDHFNIPTLKSFPESFKKKVQVLFQKNNTDKMPDAFRKLGFKHVQVFDNRKVCKLTPETSIYINQIGQMDSALAVINRGEVVLNLNDCEANKRDCKNILKDIGKVDILLNQFSIAGYNGHFNHDFYLTKQADQILDNMVENHKDLNAKVTIPFASNIYFCTKDNEYVNYYTKKPEDVQARFVEERLGCAILYPGDTIDTMEGSMYDNSEALEKYDTLYRKTRKTFDVPPVIPAEQIEEAMRKRHFQLKEKFPGWLLAMLGELFIFIPDLNIVAGLSLARGRFEVYPPNTDYDMVIYSQPLFYAFDTVWGVQTMGVGARYRIKSKFGVWRWYRIITSLNNAEMYLKLQYLFTKTNRDFVRSRLKGGLNQLVYQLQRMRR
jgi:UDP-MurNAc hydroxylase